MKAALICNPPLEWARLRMKAIRRRGFADSAIRLLDTALTDPLYALVDAG
jgi:hypothetical protein